MRNSETIPSISARTSIVGDAPLALSIQLRVEFLIAPPHIAGLRLMMGLVIQGSCRILCRALASDAGIAAPCGRAVRHRRPSRKLAGDGRAGPTQRRGSASSASSPATISRTGICIVRE